jgi:hypothetical protein
MGPAFRRAAMAWQVNALNRNPQPEPLEQAAVRLQQSLRFIH